MHCVGRMQFFMVNVCGTLMVERVEQCLVKQWFYAHAYETACGNLNEALFWVKQCLCGDLIRTRLKVVATYFYMQSGIYFFFLCSVNNGNNESLIHAFLSLKHFVTYT
jgi:hypothetical protein